MVYVVPLFLIALMLWIERGCPRPPLIAVPAAIAAVALPVALPYTKLIGLPAVSDTPALVAIWSIAPSFGGIGNLRWVVLVAGLAICAVFLFVPRRYALVLPVLVFLYFGVSQKPLEGKYRQTSILDLFQGITAPHPDWVDRAVGRDAQVTLIWSGNTDKYSVWLNEFFNRSVRHFYYTSSPLAGDLPEKPLTTDKQIGLDARAGRQGRPRPVRADGRDRRRRRPGRRPGRAEGDRPPPDRRAAAPGLARGRPLPAGHLVGPLRPVHAARLPRRRGHGQLQSDPSLFTKPTTVVATVDEKRSPGRRSAPTETEQLRVPLTRHGESCVVGFTVSPTVDPERRDERRRTPTRASSACTSPGSPTSREDRVRRLAVVPPADGRGELHPRLAARGRRGGRRRARGDPLRPDLAAGQAADPGGASRPAGDRACASSRSPTSGARAGAAPAGRRSSASSARSTCCTSRTGCTRPSAAGSARR